MKSVVIDRPGHHDIIESATLQPGVGEVVVRPTLTGVCGTDLHLYEGGFMARYPLTPGHEILGIIEAVGDGVAGLVVGQQVAVDNATACGTCKYCRRGERLYCEHFHSLGCNAPGGFSQQALVRAEKCWDTSGLPAGVAVFAEPTACVIHGMDVLQLKPGSDVLVLGAGPTGLLLSQLLLHGGASRVTIAAPTPFKLALAKTYGIDRTLQLTRSGVASNEKTLLESAPDGYDIVIDATGAHALIEILPSLTRTGGTILIYGVADEADRVAWSPYDIFRRELTIRGSFAQIDCFERALAMLRSGRLKTEGLLTHTFDLGHYGDALEALRKDPTCLKAVIAA